MATLSEVLTAAVPTANQLIGVQIRPEVAVRYAVADALLRLSGYGGAPLIISGRRSLDRQHNLFHQWERGEIRNRPASRSWHTEGLALDLDSTDPFFDLFIWIWKLFGGRWGGDFGDSDRSHIDFPVRGIVPKPAF